MIKVVLVDDNHALRTIISGKLIDLGLDLVFTATSGNDYLRKMKELSAEKYPQIILMDIEMADLNGIEATKKSRQLYPDIKVIMLTVFDDEENIFEAVKAGAHGYLLKEESSETLNYAINTVLNGGAQMSPAIALKAMQLLQAAPGKGKPLPENITPRELEILELITKGLENKEIADKLFVSYDTIKKHVAHIFDKLHVRNKAEATKVALDNRWFSFL